MYPCDRPCAEPMDLAAVKTLMSVAEKEQPDPRATHGFMRDGAYVEAAALRPFEHNAPPGYATSAH